MIRLGLIGFPVSHSKSPKLLTAALRHHKLEGEYLLYPIDPAQPQALADLLKRVRSGELTGLNVTIPHKQNVIPLLDELTPSAQAIGAVNLIYLQNGKLFGHNTDAPGFLADLKNFLALTPGPSPDFGRGVGEMAAIVLGAGGSARAVVYALANAGWKVTIVARRREQAQELSKIAHSRTDIVGFEQVAQLKADLVVNTTPLGMTPSVDTTPWPEGQPFPSEAAVYDLVYNPPQTRLVREARAAGLPATTGLGMLVEQAILGFEIWTGRTAPREVLFNAVEE